MNTRKPALGFIFTTMLLDIVGFGILVPVLPDLIRGLLGFNLDDPNAGIGIAASYGGFLMICYSAMQFIFAPILGSWSDQIGRRPVLLIAMLGLGIDYFFMAYAPTLTLLFVGRLIAGVSGANFSAATAYIADISSPEKRAQNFGLIGIAFGVGFIVGPLLGGLAGKFFGIRAPFILAGILTMINFVYGFFILPESLSKENRRRFEWKRANPVGAFMRLRKYNGIIKGFLLSIFFVYIAHHAVQSVWAYYTQYKFEWDIAMIGYSLGTAGVLVGLVQGGLIRIVLPKWGEKKTIIIGLISTIIGLVSFGFAPSGIFMFIILIPFCFGGISGPATQGILSNQVSDTEQGELQGILTAVASLTAIIGPALMTFLFHSFTEGNSSVDLPGMPYYVGGFLCLIGLIIAVISLKRLHTNS